MKLYHAPGSRSLRIYWLLEELGVEFELERCELKNTPGFHNQDIPGGKFPALVDGGAEEDAIAPDDGAGMPQSGYGCAPQDASGIRVGEIGVPRGGQRETFGDAGCPGTTECGPVLGVVRGVGGDEEREASGE